MQKRQAFFWFGALSGSALVGCGGPLDDSDDEGVVEGQSPVVVCADGDTVEGIDVSYYQGQVDWSEVAASGRRFAIARINHGTFMDPEFEANWTGIREAGLVRGAYQYFEPGDDVAYQAEVAIDHVGVLGPGDLPVTLDVETTGGVGPEAVASAVGEWLDLVEAGTGKRPMIYTGKYFWNDNVQSDAFTDSMLWIAAYGPPCPDTPNAWDDWAFWQYSSTGSVPGIDGDVDLNVFKGSAAELEAIAGIVYRGEVLSIDGPLEMEAGSEATFRIELRNAGGRAWDESTHLGTTEPRDRESPFAAADWLGPDRPAAVTSGVAPGDDYTFEITLRAPEELGEYVEHFGLVQEGEAVTWFADEVDGGPADDAIAISIAVVAAGEPSGEDGEGGSGGAPGEGATGTDDGGCASARGGSGAPASWAWVVALGCGAMAARRRHRALTREVS